MGMLIEETGCGKCAEPGDYEKIRETVIWFAEHADSKELPEMGKRGFEYLKAYLTKEISIRKYIGAINGL